jgi:flavin-dependent dehydrogenase
MVGFFSKVFSPASADGDVDLRLLIEPLEDGWWYSLQLKNQRGIMVFLTDSDLQPSGALNAKEVWKQKLNSSNKTKARYKLSTESQSTKIVPAYSQFLSNVGGEGWLAVGDACMAFDPLAASGIKKALEDGLEAAEVIAEFLDGSQTLFKNYISSRKKQFNNYLQNRHYYYLQEDRWPKSKFWQRRQVIEPQSIGSYGKQQF